MSAPRTTLDSKSPTSSVSSIGLGIGFKRRGFQEVSRGASCRLLLGKPNSSSSWPPSMVATVSSAKSPKSPNSSSSGFCVGSASFASPKSSKSSNGSSLGGANKETWVVTALGWMELEKEGTSSHTADAPKSIGYLQAGSAEEAGSKGSTANGPLTPAMATEFLFDSFDSKPARNPRKKHLKTVYDLMHLSILRRDFPRAKRAWSILIRCPEFNANKHWKLGLGMILGWDNTEDDRQQQLEFLKATMLRENRRVSGSRISSTLV